MKRLVRLVLVIVVLSGGALVWSNAESLAILSVNGAKVIVLTDDELAGMLRDKDIEIAKLKAERKTECGLI